MDIYQLKITGIDLRPAEGPGHDANAQDRSIGEVQQMRAVAIKKGQSREKSAGFQEMGTLRCDVCCEEFVVGHQPALVDKKIAERQKDKQRGWRRCLRKNPSAQETPRPNRTSGLVCTSQDLISAAWSVLGTAAHPTPARMRAFPQGAPKKYGCMCRVAGSDVRSEYCSCGSARLPHPQDETYSALQSSRVNRSV